MKNPIGECVCANVHVWMYFAVVAIVAGTADALYCTYIYIYWTLLRTAFSSLYAFHFISFHFILHQRKRAISLYQNRFFRFQSLESLYMCRYKCICLFFLLICLVQRTKLLAKTCTNQHVLRYGHTIRCYASKTNRESVSLQFGWE